MLNLHDIKPPKPCGYHNVWQHGNLLVTVGRLRYRNRESAVAAANVMLRRHKDLRLLYRIKVTLKEQT